MCKLKLNLCNTRILILILLICTHHTFSGAQVINSRLQAVVIFLWDSGARHSDFARRKA